jgi:1,4-alpha-glucan branching enzyme
MSSRQARISPDLPGHSKAASTKRNNTTQTIEKTPMKHNKKHNNGKADGPRMVPVRFELTHQTAAKVSVAGTFNDWQPEARALHRSGGGRWLNDTELPLGTYEYCLVVDGRWLPDPSAHESVPNPFGGRNSVLRVTDSPEATHLAEAEHLPLKNTNKRTALSL